MIKFFGCLWVQNWHYSYFLSHCFNFFHNCSVRIGIPWLFRTCFHTKMFSKRNFYTYYIVSSSTILIELLKLRNNSRIIATSVSNLLWKNANILNIILCYYFSLEAVLKGMAKNNLTDKQIDAEIQATLKHAPE